MSKKKGPGGGRPPGSNMKIIVRQRNIDQFPDSVPNKERAQAILEMLYDLLAELEPKGWDAPPTMGYISEPGKAVRKDGRESRFFTFRQLPGFAFAVSQFERAPWAVVFLADELRAAIKRNPAVVPESMVAAVMCSEGWSLYPSSDKAKNEGYDRATSNREIYAHPDRVECRLVHAVDTDGTRYGLHQERDGITRHLVGHPHIDGTGPVGEAMNALHYFTEVVLGRNPPDWHTWSELYDYTRLKEAKE